MMAHRWALDGFLPTLITLKCFQQQVMYPCKITDKTFRLGMSERLNTGKIELFILTSTQIKCEIAILGFMIGGVSNFPVI